MSHSDRSITPASAIVLVTTSVTIKAASQANQPMRVHLCWHGLANCPLCGHGRHSA